MINAINFAINKTETTPNFGMMIAILLLLIYTPGCDNTLEPYEEETGNYSIYGFLNLTEQEHHIRVRDLTTSFAPESSRKLDATVTFENLETSEQTELVSDTVMFNGVYTHNFVIEETIRPQEDYRIIIEDHSGEIVEAETTTPDSTETQISGRHGGCESPVEFFFEGVDGSDFIEAEATIYIANSEFYAPQHSFQETDDGIYLHITPNDLINQIFTAEEQMEIFDQLIDCSFLDEPVIELDYIIYGPDWVDYALPDHPLESEDVDSGIGFFGAIRDGNYTIPIEP